MKPERLNSEQEFLTISTGCVWEGKRTWASQSFSESECTSPVFQRGIAHRLHPCINPTLPVILLAVIKGEIKHFAVPNHCVQIVLRFLPWRLLARFTVFLFLFPKGMMSYCYPAPFQDDVRWVRSIPHARSLPSLHYAGFTVKSQTITLPDTCQHAGSIRIFYLQNYLLSTIHCRLCPPFSLSGRNEWGGKETTSSVSSCCFQSWAGKLSRRVSCTAGALDSRKAALRPQHQGGQVAREQVLQSLCVSLAAVKGVEPLWNSQSSSRDIANSLQDILHSLY